MTRKEQKEKELSIVEHALKVLDDSVYIFDDTEPNASPDFRFTNSDKNKIALELREYVSPNTDHNRDQLRDYYKDSFVPELEKALQNSKILTGYSMGISVLHNHKLPSGRRNLGKLAAQFVEIIEKIVPVKEGSYRVEDIYEKINPEPSFWEKYVLFNQYVLNIWIMDKNKCVCGDRFPGSTFWVDNTKETLIDIIKSKITIMSKIQGADQLWLLLHEDKFNRGIGEFSNLYEKIRFSNELLDYLRSTILDRLIIFSDPFVWSYFNSEDKQNIHELILWDRKSGWDYRFKLKDKPETMRSVSA